jgi:hypothetical protein
MVPNPYDVELGYNPIWDKELEVSRYVDKKVDAEKKDFLIRVQRLFESFGVDDFHEFNEYDFEYCLGKLENNLRDDIYNKIREPEEI